jgi:capsular polysaccharide biosynthesis protein
MTQPTQLGEIADDWYESEPPTRLGLVAELQRIRARTRARPLRVVILAAIVTAGITYKVVTKPVVVEAEVVLALSEGALATHHNSIPVDQLRAYVTQVLLPDSKLTQLIEKYDLHRLRKKLGPEFAIEALRGQLTVQIWKNTFVYYDAADSNAQRSARIGLTVADTDPDRAYDIARELASIAIATAAVERQKVADKLTNDIANMRASVTAKLEKLTVEIAEKQAAIKAARLAGKTNLIGILRVDLGALEHEQRRAESKLIEIVASPDALAAEIAAAGLDMSLSIVDEHQPEHQIRSNLVFVMIGLVIGTGALLGSALLLGAFDSRVHDADDVVRLALPVLGHVPGFPGDNVGSLQSRGARRARVPSFRRWRFLQ